MLHAALLNLRADFIECDEADLLEVLLALKLLTAGRNILRLRIRMEHDKLIASGRNAVKSEDLNGGAGPAISTFFPRSSNMARTRPEYTPAKNGSPSRSIP